MSDYGDLAYQIALKNEQNQVSLKQDFHILLGRFNNEVESYRKDYISRTEGLGRRIDELKEDIVRLQRQLFTACVILNAQADALVEQAKAIIALEESNKNLD